MRQLAVFLALAAAVCSTTAVDLPYSPMVPPVARGVPTIAAVTASDARDKKHPTYIGAVRGGVGNPADTIVTKDPIAAAYLLARPPPVNPPSTTSTCSVM